MTLLRWLTFLLGSLTLNVTVLPSWISFFVLTIVFILQWLSLHWEIQSQFPLPLQQTQNEMPHFIVQLDYSHANWGTLHNHLRDAAWEDIFKHTGSAVASEFCDKVQVKIVWFIYPSLQVSGQIPLISVVFSCLCCYHSSQKSPFSFVPT